MAENWIEKDTDISKANEKIIVIKLIQVIVILAISAPIPHCCFRDGQKDHYSLIVFMTVIVIQSEAATGGVLYENVFL